MQSQTVDQLPQCTECVANEITPPQDATYRVLTPTRTTSFLCGLHMDDYVEQRLGKGTVKRLAIAAGAGSKRNK